MFTSEMARRAYQSIEAVETSNDIAAGKETGAIEYCARVQLALRSVKGKTDLIEMIPSKNKHGDAWTPIYLTIDRSRQMLSEGEAPPVPDGAAERKEKSHARTHADAANLAMILTESPGLGIVKLRATASARFTLGQARVDVAVAALGAAVDERTAGRGAKPMFLDGSLLAQEVVDCVPLDHRFAVLACRPPPKERS